MYRICKTIYYYKGTVVEIQHKILTFPRDGAIHIGKWLGKVEAMLRTNTL